jgi:tetratricopeptide (TPR) repeat protein
MDYKQLFRSKYPFANSTKIRLIGVASLIVGLLSECKSIDQKQTVYSTVDTLSKNLAIFQFEQNQSKIQINMDLSSQEFEMNFNNNLEKSKSFRISGINNNELAQTVNLNKLLFYYQKSQKSFYQGQYNESLKYVDSSLFIMRTSDALALKGSILYYLKNYQGAEEYWIEAKKINPQFVKPKPNSVKK